MLLGEGGTGTLLPRPSVPIPRETSRQVSMQVPIPISFVGSALASLTQACLSFRNNPVTMTVF